LRIFIPEGNQRAGEGCPLAEPPAVRDKPPDSALERSAPRFGLPHKIAVLVVPVICIVLCVRGQSLRFELFRLQALDVFRHVPDDVSEARHVPDDVSEALECFLLIRQCWHLFSAPCPAPLVLVLATSVLCSRAPACQCRPAHGRSGRGAGGTRPPSPRLLRIVRGPVRVSSPTSHRFREKGVCSEGTHSGSQ